MDPNYLCQIFQASFSENQVDRNNATRIIHEMQRNTGYSSTLLSISMRDDIHLGIKQAALIQLKYIVQKHWAPTDQHTWVIPQQEKDFIKQNILNAFPIMHNLLRLQLGVVLASLYQTEFPNDWPTVVPSILEKLNTKDPNQIFGAVFTLRILTKSYEWINAENERRNEVIQVVNQTFPILSKLFELLLNENDIQAYEIIVLILKIFWNGTQFEIPQHLLDTKNSNPWFKNMIDLMNKELPPLAGDGQDSNRWAPLLSKKWSALILQKIFKVSCDPDSSSKQEAIFKKNYKDNVSLKFLESSFNFLSKYANITNYHLLKKVTSLCIEFVADCSTIGTTWTKIKPHIPSFLKSIMLPLLSLDQQKLELFLEDPKDFIRGEYELIVELNDPRVVVIDFLITILKNRKDNLDTVMNVIGEAFQSYQNDPDQFAILKDAAMLILGTMANFIVKSKKYSRNIEQIIITHVFPDMQSKYGFLRAKAIWTFSKFFSMEFQNDQAFVFGLTQTCQLFNDSCLPVRFQASIAIPLLIKTPLGESTFRPLLGNIFEEYFKLVDDIDNDDIVSSITELIDVYPDSIPQYAIELVNRLVMAGQKVIEREISNRVNNETDYEALDTGLHILRVIQTVLYSVKSPEITIAVEPLLIPFLLSVNNLYHDYFADFIEIFTIATGNVDDPTPNMWLVFEKYCDSFLSWAPDFLSELLSGLDNCISKGRDYFLSRKDFIEKIFNIFSNTLNNVRASDKDFGEACKLMEVVLLNCRGGVDPIIAPVIEIAVTKLSVAKYTNLKILLLEVVINALYYNPIITLQFLESKGWTSNFFGSWFSILFENFSRLHDMKLSIVALSALYLVPLNQLPEYVKNQFKNISVTIMKLTLKYAEEAKNFTLDDDIGDGDDEMLDDEFLKDIEKEFGDEEDVHFDLKKLTNMIRNTEDDEESDDLFQLEKDNEFETPLTSVSGVKFFVDSFQAFSQQEGNAFNNLLQSFNVEEMNNLEQIKKLYNELN